jgi:hypothetical protein
MTYRQKSKINNANMFKIVVSRKIQTKNYNKILFLNN